MNFHDFLHFTPNGVWVCYINVFYKHSAPTELKIHKKTLEIISLSIGFQQVLKTGLEKPYQYTLVELQHKTLELWEEDMEDK